MACLMTNINYRRYTLRDEPSPEGIDVYLRDGSTCNCRWLGWIDLGVAKHLSGALPVRLRALAVTSGDVGLDWEWLAPNQYPQGCLVAHHVDRAAVYGVCIAGSPRVVVCNKLRK